MDAKDWEYAQALLKAGATAGGGNLHLNRALDAMATVAAAFSAAAQREQEDPEQYTEEPREHDPQVLALQFQMLEERVNALNTVIVHQGRRIRTLESQLADKEG